MAHQRPCQGIGKLLFSKIISYQGPCELGVRYECFLFWPTSGINKYVSSKQQQHAEKSKA